MPDRFVYKTTKIGISGEKVKLEFGEGKNRMISMSVREFMDILRHEFPNEVFEKIEMHMAVSTEVSNQPQVGFLVTNRQGLHLMQ